MDDVAAVVVHIYLRRKLICSHIDLSSYRPVLLSPWTSNWSMLAGFILITYLCPITICITCGPTLRETARMETLHGDNSPQGRHGGQCYLCSAWFRYCSLLSSQVFHDPWSMNHADLSVKWFVLLPYSKHMWVWARMESDGLLALRLNAISACARILGELFTLCWL